MTGGGLLVIGLVVALMGMLLHAVLEGRAHTRSLAAASDQVLAHSAQIEAIFGGMIDGIMVLDADMRLLRWNDRFAEIAGVPAGLLRVGLELEHILRAQALCGEFGAVDVENEVARRTALFRSGFNVGTIERVRPNGQVLELRRNALPGGGFVTLYTDITDRRRAEERLRQAQRMEAVGQLTSGLAHDFNNLLTAIIGNIDLTERSLHRGDTGRMERHIGAARAAARRATVLVEQLLAFARKQRLQPGPIDINQVVTDMGAALRHSIGDGRRLETVLAPALWQAVADGRQLETALLNLAANACDAMDEGGTITIETSNVDIPAGQSLGPDELAPGQFVLIAVHDNGAGMSGDVLARVFEPFFTTKESGQGSGLGLSQVFGFIKQSDGHVRVDSTPGAGTTVRLFLPRAAPDPASRVIAPALPESVTA